MIYPIINEGSIPGHKEFGFVVDNTLVNFGLVPGDLLLTVLIDLSVLIDQESKGLLEEGYYYIEDDDLEDEDV